MNHKSILKLLAFCVILGAFLVATTSVLSPKGNGRNDGLRYPYLYGFASEPKNSIDILVIGNSDASSGFSPLELWGRYGVTSYVSGEIWQNMVRAVSLLNEALKYQTPRLVILETDELYSNQNNFASTWLDETVPLLQYHDRWKVIDLHNLFREPTYTTHYPFKGQKMHQSVDPYRGEFMIPSQEIQPLPFWSAVWLDRFATICRNQGINLVLVTVPSARWTHKMHNGVQQYADAKGLPYLDVNAHTQEAGFDWTLHTRDKGEHLNTAGAAKVTAYIGKFLIDRYPLKDHRGDPAFSLWREDYTAYQDFLNNHTATPEKTTSPQ